MTYWLLLRLLQLFQYMLSSPRWICSGSAVDLSGCSFALGLLLGSLRELNSAVMVEGVDASWAVSREGERCSWPFVSSASGFAEVDLVTRTVLQ